MKQNSLTKDKTKELLFYLSFMGIAVLQFVVFYVIVNANSFALAFTEYSSDEFGNQISSFVGFKNFKTIYTELFTLEMFELMWKNSFLFYAVSLLGGTVFSLAFSYYIYKQCIFANFFKIMLYLPHIVTTMVIAIIYREFSNRVLPDFLGELFNVQLRAYTAKPLPYILIFNFLMAFGSNMLVYTGTMAGISDSIVEAAQIDGANALQEFFHVIMPAIYPTFSLFIVTGMLAVFNGQGGLFNFMSWEADMKYQTFGYYLYVQIFKAGIDVSKYPPLAALGLSLTSFALPIIFTFRWFVKKVGPSVD